MAQSSIASYFNVRKRAATDECKVNRAKKVLVLDSDISQEQPKIKDIPHSISFNSNSETTSESVTMMKLNSTSRIVRRVLAPKGKAIHNEPTLSELKPKVKDIPQSLSLNNNIHSKVISNEPTLSELKSKLSRSSRLAELRASMTRFKESENQLKIVEAKSAEIRESPIKRNIELEVNVTPQKPQSPIKAYLSPKKDTTVRKNLFNLLSPTKASPVKVPISPLKTTSIKESLTLPYKYRCLAEMFRSIDTVCQMLYNRKETIIFKKVKPAVEEMIKRTLTLKHLAQIKFLYPESFSFRYEKLREFGTGTKRENWELIIQPLISQPIITAESLLERRRKLYGILIDKLKVYHREFLTTLDPPMEIPSDKITRWHPQFDIEKVPEIEVFDLPQCPSEEKFTTGSEILEKARTFLNCNTRMEQALERLKQTQQAPRPIAEDIKEGSILKGIPKALLEKVRQKQAAKALESMTRSGKQEKEAQLYSQLPEVARLARNLFVSERKSVLPLEVVVDKLCNSYRVFSNKADMKNYLKIISKEVNGWLVFHEIRGSVFVKLSKNADLSKVMSKLKSLAENKMA